MTRSTLRAQIFGSLGNFRPDPNPVAPMTFAVESSLLQLGYMASRNFDDSSGLSWHVWSTVPISGAVINPGFEKGWLTFESETGVLRRLAPVPDSWDDLPTEQLVILLERSKVVPRHTGPMRRVTPPSGVDNDAPDA